MTSQSVDRRSSRDAAEGPGAGFRTVLIGAATTFVVLALAQLYFALVLLPGLADMYSHGDFLVRQPFGAIYALSRHGVLAILLAVFDAVLFAVMYLVARRYRPWLLFVPAGVLFLTSLLYLPLAYLPVFDSMTVVK